MRIRFQTHNVKISHCRQIIKFQIRENDFLVDTHNAETVIGSPPS